MTNYVSHLEHVHPGVPMLKEHAAKAQEFATPSSLLGTAAKRARPADGEASSDALALKNKRDEAADWLAKMIVFGALPFAFTNNSGWRLYSLHYNIPHISRGKLYRHAEKLKVVVKLTTSTRPSLARWLNYRRRSPLRSEDRHTC